MINDFQFPSKNLENRPIPTDLKHEAADIEKSLSWKTDDDQGFCVSIFDIFAKLYFIKGTASEMDDEYKWAGVEDPKIVITTSREPSAKLKQFVKVVFCNLMIVFESWRF